MTCSTTGVLHAMLFLVVFVAYGVHTGKCKDLQGDRYAIEKNLIDSIKENYDPVIRPWLNLDKNDSRLFPVYITVYLYALSGIDEKEETLTSVLSFAFFWWDDKVTWNPADHANITHIYMRAADVWRPIWFITNSNDKESVIEFDDWVPIRYKSDGMALWQQMGTIKTSCDIDTTFYPFDKQQCSVKLHWYEYEVNINVYKENEHLKNYDENGMWDLYHYDMITRDHNPAFELKYNLRRKPDYTIFNILFPVLLVTLLAPLVFVLPVESGERISYSITVLLTVSVYMTIISDNLPHTSSPMSLLTYGLFSLYVFCTLIVVVIITTTKLYQLGATNPVPNSLRVLLRVFGCRKLCKRHCACVCKVVKYRPRRMRRSKEVADESANRLNVSQEDAVETGKEDRKETGGNDVNENETEVLSEVTWQDIARAIDRVALYGFYIMKLLFGIVGLCVIYAKAS